MPTRGLVELPAVAGGEPAFDEFLIFGQPVLGEDEIASVADVIRSTWIGTGGQTQEFERRFAETVGATRAIAVSSCTAALHVALVAHGIGPGDQVITTPFTFVATLHAIIHAGAEPVLADVDPITFNIDPEQVEALIGPKTRAILPVHFGGLPVDLVSLRAIGAERGIVIIEDAAHAFGARLGGREIGGDGGTACFSFYPNKNITTGEGGMVTTEDEAVAERLHILRLHGLSRDAWERFRSKRVTRSDAVALGFKYNMTDMQAALGLVQLGRAKGFLETRRKLANIYDRELADVPGLRTQPRPWTDEVRHAHHLYVVVVDRGEFGLGRDELLEALRAENIGAGIHYKAAHLHPYYEKRLGLPAQAFPAAAELSTAVLSLPLSPAMTEEDTVRVAGALRRIHRYFFERK
jgi:dTDP-4-amino-4,6-dideoxygalactose transaminase